MKDVHQCCAIFTDSSNRVQWVLNWLSMLLPVLLLNDLQVYYLLTQSQFENDFLMFFILLLLVFSSQKRLSLVIDEFVFNASPNATPPLSLISVSGDNEQKWFVRFNINSVSLFQLSKCSECCVGLQCFTECLSKYFSILCFCFEEMNEKQKCLKFCRSSLDSLP